MSSKRDLVEAHSFNRRRLVTAFVSGAPGGREVEPVRYGRTLVGGLVLALLIVAGAAVSGFIKPAVPDDWKESGLVIGKDSGSRFVAYEGYLYPVINTTSARLILGAEGDMKITFVPDDQIADAEQIRTIGIPGAPDVVPEPSQLVQTGWSACTDASQGLLIDMEADPASTPVPDEMLVVQNEGDTWLLSGTRRYLLPSDGTARASILRNLAVDDQPVRAVKGSWLDLIPVGQDLEPFAVEDTGRKVETGVKGLTTVGTPVDVDGAPYVVSADGSLVRLTDFAAAIYSSSGPGATLAARAPGGTEGLTTADVAGVDQAEADGLFPSTWPTAIGDDYATADTACLRLDAAPGEIPQVSVAAATDDAPEIKPARTTRVVEPGGGAVVQAATGAVLDSGRVFLIDSTGTRYAVGDAGDTTGALTALGYADVALPPVPEPWTKIWRDGPTLSRADAGRDPATLMSDSDAS